MVKKKNGICCICGKEGKLTFEHIPPHAAFNHSNLKMYDVIRYLRDNQTRYPSLQNGAGLSRCLDSGLEKLIREPQSAQNTIPAKRCEYVPLGSFFGFLLRRRCALSHVSWSMIAS